MNKKVDASDLLNGMWRDSKRVKMVVSRSDKNGGFKHTPVANAAEGNLKASELSGRGEEVYFACAVYLTGESRKQENVCGAHGFWADVDCGQEKATEGKGYLDSEQAIVALKKFCDEAGISM